MFAFLPYLSDFRHTVTVAKYSCSKFVSVFYGFQQILYFRVFVLILKHHIYLIPFFTLTLKRTLPCNQCPSPLTELNLYIKE